MRSRLKTIISEITHSHKLLKSYVLVCHFGDHYKSPTAIIADTWELLRFQDNYAQKTVVQHTFWALSYSSTRLLASFTRKSASWINAFTRSKSFFKSAISLSYKYKKHISRFFACSIASDWLPHPARSKSNLNKELSESFVSSHTAETLTLNSKILQDPASWSGPKFWSKRYSWCMFECLIVRYDFHCTLCRFFVWTIASCVLFLQQHSDMRAAPSWSDASQQTPIPNLPFAPQPEQAAASRSSLLEVSSSTRLFPPLAAALVAANVAHWLPLSIALSRVEHTW